MGVVALEDGFNAASRSCGRWDYCIEIVKIGVAKISIHRDIDDGRRGAGLLKPAVFVVPVSADGVPEVGVEDVEVVAGEAALCVGGPIGAVVAHQLVELVGNFPIVGILEGYVEVACNPLIFIPLNGCYGAFVIVVGQVSGPVGHPSSSGGGAVGAELDGQGVARGGDCAG